MVAPMKLMYCAHCGDIVRLFAEKRFCKCGKSWGRYLEDGATTVQTWPGLSLGIANPDFAAGRKAFGADVEHFSPLLALRCWINPVSEPDVKFVLGVPDDAEEPHDAEEPGDPGGAADESGAADERGPQAVSVV
jgi:hypothetical protein